MVVLRGVRGVHNRIRVEGKRVAAATVRSAIEAALTRHARHEASHVRVSVDDGIVTLTGPVDSFAEKRAVMGLVSHLPGVRMVRDRLVVPS